MSETHKHTEYRVFGSPGAGKTTHLVKTIKQVYERGQQDDMLLVSFTRTAAQNLIDRTEQMLKKKAEAAGEYYDEFADDAKPNIGTLHAIAWRSLGKPPIAETRLASWNEAYPHLTMSGASSANVDDLDEIPTNDNAPGAKLLAELNLLRSRMIPSELYPESIRQFKEKWNGWKRETSCIDFTDMIHRAYMDVAYAPSRPHIFIADEAQDFSRLQFALFRKWSAHSEYSILAGDDEQCSVEGTLVTMSNGSLVPIEDVVEGARVRGYNLRGAQLQTDQIITGICKSKYSGKAFRVTVGDNSTKTTPNHKWHARWSDSAKTAKVVYLMRQGKKWRVGWCQLIRSDGCSHLSSRARLEKADEMWVLKVVPSKEEAFLYESFVAATFGLPTMCFEPTSAPCRGHINHYVTSKLWDELLNPGQQLNNAKKCLEYFYRSIEYPFYKKGTLNTGGAKTFPVCSYNLLQDVMSLPLPQGVKEKALWEPCKVDVFYYSGFVYGLNVEDHHNYIADGIITHNCLYSFTGASAEAFLNPPVPENQIQILPKSYRLPKRVLEFSRKWAERISVRQPKNIVGTELEGQVLVAPPSFKLSNKDAVMKAVESYIEKDKQIMLLATCSYMLNDIRAALKDRGIPFHNPYRLKRGDWNPIRKSSTVDRILAFLAYSRKVNGENYRPWTTTDIALWASAMRVKDGLVKHGASKILKAWSDREYPENINAYEALEQVFDEDVVQDLIMKEPDLDWYFNQMLPDKAKSSQYPLDIIRKRGVDALRDKPNVVLGTVHSVKGAECDVTFLWPDLSWAGFKELNGSLEKVDSIRKVMYVGATRCRETLILGAPSSNYCINWSK